MLAVARWRLVSLLAVCTMSCGQSAPTTLIVCVIEGDQFARRTFDEVEYNTDVNDVLNEEMDKGVDAMVSLFVNDELISTTLVDELIVNDRSPEFDQCFDVPGQHDADTPLTFVATDSDLERITRDAALGEDERNGLDIVGSACTPAQSGMRWIDLVGPDGAFAGRLHVQIIHLLAARDDAMQRMAIQNVASPASALPIVGSSIDVNAAVSCPDGYQMISCQCLTLGHPGCASSRVQGSACVATGAEYYPVKNLPTCEKDWFGRYIVTPGCSSPNFKQLSQRAPHSVIATAQCASTAAIGSVTSVFSESSAGYSHDRVFAQCAEGDMPLGCSVFEGTGEQLGALYSHRNRGTTLLPPSSAAANGRPQSSSAGSASAVGLDLFHGPACQGISGKGGSSTATEARCASQSLGSIRSAGGVALSTISFSMKARYVKELSPTGEEVIRNMTARCPPRFAMVGCTCFALARRCFGAGIVPAADGSPVCTATFSEDFHYGFQGPAYLYINCLWQGEQSQVVTSSDETKDRTCADANAISLNLFARINEVYAQQLVDAAKALQRGMEQQHKEALESYRGEIPGGFFQILRWFLGGCILTSLLLGCCCCHLQPRECVSRRLGHMPCYWEVVRSSAVLEAKVDSILSRRHAQRDGESVAGDAERAGAGLLGLERLPPSDSHMHMSPAI